MSEVLEERIARLERDVARIVFVLNKLVQQDLTGAQVALAVEAELTGLRSALLDELTKNARDLADSIDELRKEK